MAHLVRSTHYVDRNSIQDAGIGALGLVARVVYFIVSIITGLLAIRFILALLGANSTNAFAHFIYSTSQPFAAPFFGLFNYHSQFGVSRFEFESLIAIVVYSLLAWLVARLLTLFANTTNDSVE